MAKVEVWQPIRFGGYWGRSELLTTIYDMAFLPDVGDRFHPFKNDEESGETFTVYKRWWDEKGAVILECPTLIVQPPDDVVAEIVRRQDLRPYADGTIVDMLLANGWWRHGEGPLTTATSVDARVVNIHFTQHVFNEEGLSAADIYRQTKNLLSDAEARVFGEDADAVAEETEEVKEDEAPSVVLDTVAEILKSATSIVMQRLLFGTATPNDLDEALKKEDGDDDGPEPSPAG
jgi:hypothetical protein